MSAVWIAAKTGWEAAEVAQSIDIGLALLSILVTQLFAALGHPAVKLIMWGIERQPVTAPAEKPTAAPKPRPAPQRKQRASRKAPATVVEQVQAWAYAALIGRPGCTAAATDAHAAFSADTGHQLSQAALGTAMAEIGFNKAKRGGKVSNRFPASNSTLRTYQGLATPSAAAKSSLLMITLRPFPWTPQPRR